MGYKAYYSTGLNAQKNCVAVVRIEGAVEANTPIIIEGTGTVNIPVADENANSPMLWATNSWKRH